VHKILKLINFHPYKVKLIQKPNDDDLDCGLKFCDVMLERIDANPNLLFNIVFFDETT